MTIRSTLIYQNGQPILNTPGTRVCVVSGPDKGAEVPLVDARVRVGSAADNQLVLTDQHVSRHHVEFLVTDTGYLARDLQSTNGTYFRGARIHEATLTAASEVQVGATKLRLDVGAEVARRLAPRPVFGRLIGTSPPMQRLYGLLTTIAPLDVTVLVEGETGTGKELVAEAVHQASPRRNRPFSVVDCAAIPPTLIESELFGHEAGAFTGATRQRVGAFERATGGTVFIDEIGELALPLQQRLLRVLDRRQVRRVGGDINRKVDVRVIAATNRDLRREVNQGRFRADLYYRLCVMRVELPPLRERGDDILALARSFLWAAGCATPDSVLNDDLKRLLRSRSWPGNVRELNNVIQRAVILSAGGALELPEPSGVAPVPQDGVTDESSGRQTTPAATDQNWLIAAMPREFLERDYRTAKEELLFMYEAPYLRRLLARHGANLSAIAREAGVDRQLIRRMLDRCSLKLPK